MQKLEPCQAGVDRTARYCVAELGLAADATSELIPFLSKLLEAGEVRASDKLSRQDLRLDSVCLDLCVWLVFGDQDLELPIAPSAELREAALSVLLRTVQYIARPIGQRLLYDAKDERVDDAIQHLWVKLIEREYTVGRFAFRGWASKVIRNHIIQEIRQAKKNGPVEEPDNLQAPPEPELVRIVQRLLTGPFSDECLEHIRQWRPVRDRIVLLVCFGLWHKVPKDEADRWCREAGLDPAGPEGGFPFGYERGSRQQVAAWLGMRPAALDQVISRKRRWLQELPCLHEFRDLT